MLINHPTDMWELLERLKESTFSLSTNDTHTTISMD